MLGLEKSGAGLNIFWDGGRVFLDDCPFLVVSRSRFVLRSFVECLGVDDVCTLSLEVSLVTLPEDGFCALSFIDCLADSSSLTGDAHCFGDDKGEVGKKADRSVKGDVGTCAASASISHNGTKESIVCVS